MNDEHFLSWNGKRACALITSESCSSLPDNKDSVVVCLTWKKQAGIFWFFLVITERMHLKAREKYVKELIFWEMETGPAAVLHCCCSFCFCLLCLCTVVFFVLSSELCLIVVAIPLPPFRSSSYLCRLELEQWSVKNLLSKPCSFPTDNQSVFGWAGLNLGKN